MSRLFNAYVMVNWSAAAAAKVGKDGVWIGVLKRDIRFRLTFEAFNPPTRKAGEDKLREVLADLRRRGDRALVGFDIPFGFPAGAIARLQLKDASWAGLWAFLAKDVVDKADNTNNRFAVANKMNRLMTGEAKPFWGAPAKDAQTWLSSTKPVHGDDLPPPFRATERAAQGLTKAGTKSIWQLFGAGAVGGQAIVGMPAVKRLKDELGDKALVWPLESGWRALTPDDLAEREVVLAEVYPAMVTPKPEPGEAADRAQVRALAEHFAKLDEAGKLAATFAAPKTADEATVALAETEEGWILGV